MEIDLLKKIGFSDKSAKIYLALLSLGPSSVRKLAEVCKLNRGTTYDTLKELKEQNLVNYYKKDTKQYFVAEDPAKLHLLVEHRKEELQTLDQKLEKNIPELQALYNNGGERPVAKYYEKNEINQILEDVLNVCEEDEEKMYRIYSTEGMRECLYKNFQTFSDVRVSKGISVKVISLGNGGELRGLDERKWLLSSQNPGTNIIIYPNKTAYVSLNTKQEPVGVVIENQGVYETQKAIFDQLWKSI